MSQQYQSIVGEALLTWNWTQVCRNSILKIQLQFNCHCSWRQEQWRKNWIKAAKRQEQCIFLRTGRNILITSRSQASRALHALSIAPVVPPRHYFCSPSTCTNLVFVMWKWENLIAQRTMAFLIPVALFISRLNAFRKSEVREQTRLILREAKFENETLFKCSCRSIRKSKQRRDIVQRTVHDR